MNIVLILAHPKPGSFNHAIAQACSARLLHNGHQVVAHDLYAERFDPILPHGEFAKDAALPPQIARHCDEVSRAQGIIIVHPNWWGQPPAMLKGWMDRVLRPGVAYEFLEGDAGEGVPRGLLQAECAVVFNTSNTEVEREKRVFGDPLEVVWKNCVFGLCGARLIHRRTFTIVITSSAEQRREWLSEVAATMDRYFPRTSATPR